MDTVLFSVIIPTYNRADLLRITLKSLALQEFTAYEAFIIDDGSTDDTALVFKEFSHHPRWYFHRLDANKGQAYCRNLAIQRSAGEYITFLDADDVWLPGRLSAFADKINEGTAAGFIFSNGYIMQGKVITSCFFDERRKIPAGKLEPYMAISNYWLPYVTTNVAIMRKATEKTGLFREDMSHLEDMELYTRILRHFEADYIPEPLSVYRIHSLTGTPASLTLKWDNGIEDFHTSLETAAPPEDVRRLLTDYVYFNQAVVYIKNGLGGKARPYLNKIIRRSVKISLVHYFSFAPRSILALLRFLFRGFRSRKLSLFPEKRFKRIQRWVESISKQ